MHEHSCRGKGQGSAVPCAPSGSAKPSFNRRNFLKRGAWSIAAFTVVGAGVTISKHGSRREPLAARGADANPFAYDLTQLKKTDPNLIRYEEVGRFPCPHPEPRRIAFGPRDQLYLAAGNYVTTMDRVGGVLSEIALSTSPRAAAVAGDELIYISLRDHIEVFDPKGQRRAAWDSPAPRTWMSGLAVSENELFAADAVHRLVLRYDRSGKLLRRLGQKDPDRGVPGFIVPSPFFDLAMARDGLLRITNPGRHRVDAYTINGDFEFCWGKGSAAIEGFCGCCNPISLRLLPDGRCITCEKGLPRVKIYSPDGAFESVVAGTEAFPENAKLVTKDDADGTQGGLDAAADSEGRIYILDPVARDVRILAKKKGEANQKT